MNFFQHQDDARRSTGRLVILFTLAVVSLVVLTNLLLIVALYGLNSQGIANISSGITVDWELFLQVSVWVVGTIALVTLFKWLQLRGGGRVVAERMGGRLITYSTAGPEERQLLNVVEEMAIAAGLPVPPVYLLEEQGINAFAAGYSGNDAVIGITRGALQALNRDQLQGVIGHEFSHILHGDMRLNLRLIAVLAGILFIGQAGRVVLHSSSRRSLLGGRSRNKSGLPVIVIGLGLLLIGYIGMLLGNLIKAAVSRQREFLADASAVQYTRNPDGIADALKVIGGSSTGSQLHTGKAEENSHLFFSNALVHKVSSAFATHPPLGERIRRIAPDWDGQYLQPELVSSQDTPPAEEPDTATAVPFVSAAINIPLADHISRAGELNQQLLGQSKRCIASIPDQLRTASQHPYYARALIFALLLDQGDKQIKAQQLALLEDGIKLRQRTEELLPEVLKLAREQRLPLVELAVPALKQQSFRQYQNFKQLLQQLIEVDQHIELFEWMLQRLLLQYLEGTFDKPGKSAKEIYSLQMMDIECYEILSLLAYRGHDSFYSAEYAFHRALSALGIGPAKLIHEEALTYNRIDNALLKLNQLRMPLKEQFLQACASCIETDSKITTTERELMRVVAASLDCPVPVLTSD